MQVKRFSKLEVVEEVDSHDDMEQDITPIAAPQAGREQRGASYGRCLATLVLGFTLCFH